MLSQALFFVDLLVEIDHEARHRVLSCSALIKEAAILRCMSYADLDMNANINATMTANRTANTIYY